MKIRYVGRRSGATFEIPVGYRRSADSIVIAVAVPMRSGGGATSCTGGPLVLVNFDGRDRWGHAIARRDGRGRVVVTVELDPW